VAMQMLKLIPVLKLPALVDDWHQEKNEEVDVLLKKVLKVKQLNLVKVRI
jgi:hypothetical protein